MKTISKAIAFIFALVFSLQVGAQGISEASVKAFLAKFDQAIAAKNVAAIGQLLGNDVEILVTVTARGKTQKNKMDKTQYLAALRDHWSMTTNYTYRRSNENITISGNVATVSADVRESMMIHGQYVATRLKETATIELANGALAVTKVVGNGSM